MIVIDPVRDWGGHPVLIYGPSYVSDAAKIGRGTKIGAFCNISSVIIGENCNIQCHVSIPTGTIIGNNVFIGPGVKILNDLYPASKRLTPPTIHNEAILGGGCIINPGVMVGHNSVVCSGALVTGDVPPDTVYMSKTLPATHHCSRQSYNQKQRRHEKRKPRL